MFAELPELLRGDELLVVNNARVIPARLFGLRRGDQSEPIGKQSRQRAEYLSSVIEVLLTRNVEGDTWEALVRPGRKVRVGEHILFGEGELEAEVIDRGELGLRRLRFSCPVDHAANAVRKQLSASAMFLCRPTSAVATKRKTGCVIKQFSHGAEARWLHRRLACILQIQFSNSYARAARRFAKLR